MYEIDSYLKEYLTVSFKKLTIPEQIASLKREGFLPGLHNPEIIKPIHNESSWKGKELFLENLSKIERSGIPKNVYRHKDRCELCNWVGTGSCDYYTDTYTWPSHLAHYISKHNFKPSSNFIIHICTISLE